MNSTRLALAFLDSEVDPMFGIDDTSTVVYANDAARRLLPSQDRLEGEPIANLLGDSNRLSRAMLRSWDQDEAVQVRLPMKLAGRPLELYVALQRHAVEAETSVLKMRLHGASRRRFVDERRRQRNRLATTERVMAGFAHQLRNPLAAISSLAENLAAEMEDEDPRVEYTSRLLNQVEKMERLIRSGLHFTPQSNGQQEAQSAADLAAAALHQFEARIGLRPASQIAADVGQVRVDPIQIVECLELLLDRAHDVCGGIESVELRVQRESSGPGGDLIRFAVLDQGPTIALGDLPSIFEPFFTNKATGLGFGMAMAQVLAVQNNGTLEVCSSGGETRFELWLEAVPEGAEG